MTARSADRACPVARTLDLVGDRWSLLIIRDAFDGVRRFSQFQRSLGIARNILSSRLRDLVQAGILRAEPASDGSSYQDYVLTDAGLDFFDLMISLRQWGQDHAFAAGEEHSVLVDATTGRPLPRMTYTTPDGGQVTPHETRVRKVGETPWPPVGGTALAASRPQLPDLELMHEGGQLLFQGGLLCGELKGAGGNSWGRAVSGCIRHGGSGRTRCARRGCPPSTWPWRWCTA
jgi:DNA-binding HxlR family transcriptional regulator